MSSAALRSLLAGRGVTQPWTHVSLGDPRSTPSPPPTASSCASAAVPLVGTRSLVAGGSGPGELGAPVDGACGWSASRASLGLLGLLGSAAEVTGTGPEASGFSAAG